MQQNFLSELFIYRHRFIIGYIVLALITISLLVFRVGDLPPGYTTDEQNSAVVSRQLQLTLEGLPTLNVVDLPYHLLQKFTLHFMGLGAYGIRLPSIIVALLVSVGIFLLLRRWFTENIAIMGGIIAVTSTHFLIRGRIGTPEIMISLWSIWILLFATLISQQAKFKSLYKVLLIATVGLSLYTPYMIYLLVAAGLATLIHPHLRYILRKADKIALTIAALLCAIIVAPLGWYLYMHPVVIRDFLGIPAELPSLWQYIKQLLSTFNNMGGPFNPRIGEALVPGLGIPAMALFILGIVRSVQDFHSTRTHLLLIWMTLIVPVSALHPSSQAVLFVPVYIFIAVGVNALVRMWYNLFPRNPYARIFGLAPIGLLLIAIVQFNYTRYFVGLPYSEGVVRFDNDARLLHKAIDKQKLRDKPVQLVAPKTDHAFYSLETSNAGQLTLADRASFNAKTPGTVIVKEAEYQKLAPTQKAVLGKPSNIIVNDRANNALRFRVFNR